MRIQDNQFDMNPNFWYDKIVIVTGGAGFLGTKIVDKLQARGVTKIVVPRRNRYDLRNIEAVHQLYQNVGLSISPQTYTEQSSSNVIVIHLAANVGGIGVNRMRPAEFFYDNLMMGTQLMHEAWQYNVEKFVAIGTICAYPKFTQVPFQEEHLWDGYPEETNAPYGLAKKMMLVQSQAYREQYKYNSIFLLPVNLYGPGDNFDLDTSHVIPALIRKCVDAQNQQQEQIIAWGDGSPTREFLYVDDCAEGILLATEQYNKSEPINLGSSFEISIKDLMETIARLVEFKGEIMWDTTKPNGQPRRKLDVSKARTEFDFQSTTPFEEGLLKTIEWYRTQTA